MRVFENIEVKKNEGRKKFDKTCDFFFPAGLVRAHQPKKSFQKMFRAGAPPRGAGAPNLLFCLKNSGGFGAGAPNLLFFLKNSGGFGVGAPCRGAGATKKIS